MSKYSTARAALKSRTEIAILEAAGVDPREAGKVLNRAAPPTLNPNPDDVDRITVPDNAADLEAMMADPAQMRGVMGNPLALKTFIKNYVKASNEANPDIRETVRNETQRFMIEYLKEHGDTRGSKLNLDTEALRAKHGAGNTVYNRRALGTQLDGVFEDSTAFLTAMSPKSGGYNSAEARAARGRHQEITDAFGSTAPADGGFLIPETLRAQLLSVALETSIVRPRATVIPMETLRVPMPLIDSVTNSGSVFGGIICYWGEEGATLTESSAKFGRVVLDAKKLTGFAGIPNELMADASAMAGFFNAKFPQALAFFEDRAFMKGSGVGEPLGWINCNAAIIAAAIAGQGANTIAYENIVAMFSRMLPTSMNTAVWIASIDTLPQLATMALSVGTGGAPVWLGGNSAVGGAAAASPMSILGRPVIFTEKGSTLGTTGDISFVDLSYYLIGDRQAMSVDESPHYLFGNDKVAFRIIERVDGRPWLQSAITPENGGPTLSPFVQLSSTRT